MIYIYKLHIYIDVHKYIRTHIFTLFGYLYMYIYIYIHIYINICIYKIYVYMMYVYMYIYAYVYVYIYIIFLSIYIYTFSSCLLQHCNISYFVSQFMFSHALHNLVFNLF